MIDSEHHHSPLFARAGRPALALLRCDMKKMKQGIFKDIVKFYYYECPVCGKENRISERVWEKQDHRRCSKCSKVFRTDPDHGTDMTKVAK